MIESRRQKTEDRRQKKTCFLLISVFCFLSSLTVMMIAGCGYTTRSMISNKYRTIYVAPFMNKTEFTAETAVAGKYKIYRPLLETDISRETVNKYIFDGNLKPVEKESADLALKGELVEFRRDPLRYTDDNVVEEYRLNLIVNISLWDNRENRLLWEEAGFTGDTTYFTIGSQAISDDAAINAAIKDLARRIVERTVEQW